MRASQSGQSWRDVAEHRRLTPAIRHHSRFCRATFRPLRPVPGLRRSVAGGKHTGSFEKGTSRVAGGQCCYGLSPRTEVTPRGQRGIPETSGKVEKKITEDTLGEILDVVHIQDRAFGIGDVLRLTRAARVLAVPFAAQQHGTPRRLQAQDVNAYPRLAEPGTAIASTGSDSAKARCSSSSGVLARITSLAGTSSSATPASASPAPERIASWSAS